MERLARILGGTVGAIVGVALLLPLAAFLLTVAWNGVVVGPITFTKALFVIALFLGAMYLARFAERLVREGWRAWRHRHDVA